MVLDIIIVLTAWFVLYLAVKENNKVSFYAWNMPEAYMPAKRSLVLAFVAGFLIGLIR